MGTGEIIAFIGLALSIVASTVTTIVVVVTKFAKLEERDRTQEARLDKHSIRVRPLEARQSYQEGILETFRTKDKDK